MYQTRLVGASSNSQRVDAYEYKDDRDRLRLEGRKDANKADSVIKHRIVSYLGNREVSKGKFVVRVEELWKIQDILESSRAVIIQGIAGIGKTSIARLYADNVKDYTLIWFSADSQVSLAISYREFGRSLGLDLDKQEETVIIMAVNSRLLSSGQRLLFIFDNLEGNYADPYVKTLPKNVKLLITTRHENLLDYLGSEIRLVPFSQGEAVKYINDNGIQKEGVDLLVREIGTIPQRLSLAVGYLKDNREKTIQDIIVDLRRKTILRVTRDQASKELFEVIIDQLIEEHEDEWELLQAIAWLDPNFIPEYILLALAGDKKEGLWSAIGRLENLSLVKIVERDNGKGIELHREIQDQTINYVNEHPNKSRDPSWSVEQLLQLLNKLLHQITKNSDGSWVKTKLLVLSIESVFDHINGGSINLANSVTSAELNDKLSKIYAEMFVDFKRALNYEEHALQIRLALHTGDHPEVIKSTHNVGIAHHRLGDARRGLHYYKIALAMTQRIYPGDNPIVANSFNHIGRAYHELEDYREGLYCFGCALRIWQTIYDGNHNEVAQSFNNVGMAYHELGNYRHGLYYFKRSLKMRQALYTGNLPETAICLSNLGLAYDALGDYLKSFHYFERSLQMRQALYPADHHDITKSLNDVEIAYKNLDYGGKLSLYQKKANSNKGFIKKRGSTSQNIIRVKQKIQKTLDAIQKLSAKGILDKKFVSLYSCVIFGCLDQNYLIRPLLDLYDAENLNAARCLGFEAINLGIASSYKQNPIFAIEFAKTYPELIAEIVREHPEYFITEAIAKVCLSAQDYQALVAPASENAPQQEEFKGQGTFSYAVNSYFEYYNSGIDRSLELRLQGLTFSSNVLFLRSQRFTKPFSLATEKLVDEVRFAFSSHKVKTILAPINLYNKHWIGLLLRNSGTAIEVIYIDPEQKEMLPALIKALENSLAVIGYKSRFSEAKLEQQRYNNCGSELIENFIYCLTGTRATQEGAIYLHSLLLENNLLNQEEYVLKIEENNRFIGLLSNTAPVNIVEIPLLNEQILKLEERLMPNTRLEGYLRSFGIELFCKKLLYRQDLKKFAGMINEYGIELHGGLTTVDVLLDNSKFNKLIMNKIHPDKNPFGETIAHEDTLFIKDLRDKLAADLKLGELIDDGLMKINSMLHKSSIGFKSLDIVVDSARLAYEPSLTQGKKLVLDCAHLHGLMVGANSYSLAVSGAEATYQLHVGEYQKAFDVATGTLSAMALPIILAHANRPYLGLVYSLAVAASTAYNTVENAYSFALEISSDDATIRSKMAYKELIEWLSYGFDMVCDVVACDHYESTLCHELFVN